MSQNTESIAVLEITCGETTGYMVQEVNQLPYRIGRSTNCQLQLTEPAVWAEHLEIDLDDERRFILRRLSETTAMINGMPAKVVAPLRNGDYVQFGTVTMRFSLGSVRQKNLSIGESITWTILAVIIITETILLLWLT